MDKLNELVETADYAISSGVYSINVKVSDILAIAEAFRELEQDKLRLNSVINTVANRAEAAEAKLAELEKQEPVEWMLQCWDDTVPEENIWFNYQRYSHRVTAGKNQRVIEYFNRPAPAVSLLELVPDEIYIHSEMDFLRKEKATSHNKCRAEMLSRIGKLK